MACTGERRGVTRPEEVVQGSAEREIGFVNLLPSESINAFPSLILFLLSLIILSLPNIMDLHSTTQLDFDRRFFRSVSPAAQREAIAREQNQLEVSDRVAVIGPLVHRADVFLPISRCASFSARLDHLAAGELAGQSGLRMGLTLFIESQRTALNSARDAVSLLQLQVRHLCNPGAFAAADSGRSFQLRRGVQNNSLSATPLAPFRPTSSSPPPAFTSGSAALRLQALARQTEAEGLEMKLQEVESRASSRAASRIASRAVSRASSELGDDSEMESDSDDEDEEADEEREINEEWWRDQRRLEQGEVDVNGVRIKRIRRSGHAIPERAGR